MNLTRHYLNVTEDFQNTWNLKWQRFKYNYWKFYKKQCAVCGYEKKIELHHIEPRHLFPEKALEEKNMIPLCKDCHFHIGHWNNFKEYNKNIIKIERAINKVAGVKNG